MQEFAAFHGTSAPAGIDDFYLSWTREKVFWYQGSDAMAEDSRGISLFRSPSIPVFLTNSLNDILAAGAAQPKGLGSPATSEKSLISC